MTTYKKLADEFQFAGKYKKLFVYKKDEKGVPVPVEYIKPKKPALSEVDYADYMNEVMNQEAEAEHAFDEEFEAAAKTAHEEQVAKELKVQMSMKEEKELEKFNKEEEKNANTVTTFLTGNEEVDELEAIMFGEPEDDLMEHAMFEDDPEWLYKGNCQYEQMSLEEFLKGAES
jgi:hypothetical protein